MTVCVDEPRVELFRQKNYLRLPKGYVKFVHLEIVREQESQWYDTKWWRYRAYVRLKVEPEAEQWLQKRGALNHRGRAFMKHGQARFRLRGIMATGAPGKRGDIEIWCMSHVGTSDTQFGLKEIVFVAAMGTAVETPDEYGIGRLRVLG